MQWWWAFRQFNKAKFSILNNSNLQRAKKPKIKTKEKYLGQTPGKLNLSVSFKLTINLTFLLIWKFR